MRKAIKYPESRIITDKLQYISGDSTNNKKISEVLLNEQKSYCAYTDEFISRTDARDIEHFNPTLKDTAEDNYTNWFLVKHQWNKEKSYKWEEYQPIIHPTAEDFEERIIYFEGDYIPKSEADISAKNLIRLLKLDDPGLAEKRKKYIKRKRADMEAYQEDPVTFFKTLIDCNNCDISYIRAIEEEFNVDLWETLD
jgi:hypothetical protein